MEFNVVNGVTLNTFDELPPDYLNHNFLVRGKYMATHDVTVFEPYPFEVGQKINISGGPRKGEDCYATRMQIF